MDTPDRCGDAARPGPYGRRAARGGDRRCGGRALAGQRTGRRPGRTGPVDRGEPAVPPAGVDAGELAAADPGPVLRRGWFRRRAQRRRPGAAALAGGPAAAAAAPGTGTGRGLDSGGTAAARGAGAGGHPAHGAVAGLASAVVPAGVPGVDRVDTAGPAGRTRSWLAGGAGATGRGRAHRPVPPGRAAGRLAGARRPGRLVGAVPAGGGPGRGPAGWPSSRCGAAGGGRVRWCAAGRGGRIPGERRRGTRRRLVEPGPAVAVRDGPGRRAARRLPAGTAGVGPVAAPTRRLGAGGRGQPGGGDSVLLAPVGVAAAELRRMGGRPAAGAARPAVVPGLGALPARLVACTGNGSAASGCGVPPRGTVAELSRPGTSSAADRPGRTGTGRNRRWWPGIRVPARDAPCARRCRAAADTGRRPG